VGFIYFTGFYLPKKALEKEQARQEQERLEEEQAISLIPIDDSPIISVPEIEKEENLVSVSS
jgi:hypothetical protein